VHYAIWDFGHCLAISCNYSVLDLWHARLPFDTIWVAACFTLLVFGLRISDLDERLTTDACKQQWIGCSV
jgi:hypothetical protein